MKIKYAVISLLLIMSTLQVSAQILNPKKILERKLANKTNQVIDKKTDQVVDSVFNSKSSTKPTSKKDTVPVVANEQQQDGVATPDVANQPSLQTYSKFDFTPGEKVIFFEDFSQDNVGDFPALWNTNSSAEVVTTNLFPGRWMKFSTREAIWTDALLTLPDNYTIEFDVIPVKGVEDPMAGYTVRLIQSINAKAYDYGAVPGKAGFAFSCDYSGRPGYRTYINDPEGELLGISAFIDDHDFYQILDQRYHISIWMQKARVRLYVNEYKLIDLPKAFPVSNVKMDRLRFEEGAAMVSNIRIAAGSPDMRNKLITEGKLVSYGIYFDVNSDKVKAESYGTLKLIADVLKDNAGVKINIVGHTDADGNDASNLNLSKRRAASVKTELVSGFGIAATRIATDGKGESQPLAPNDNNTNKALNRRVEFIKL